jgi:hypothetical protein
MDLDLLEELAFDPRAYDHGHPVNHRPGYQFGEWDPDLIDNRGRYRRFILRKMILDALCEWLSASPAEHEADTLVEASAALAGTMLLASGISGWGPGAFASDVSLTKLVPRVAAYRDAFYADLIKKIKGKHGQRLREESKRFHQPFGAVRSFLNQYVARQRADQIERHHLSLLFARMGQSEASREQASQIQIPATRFRAQITTALLTARREAVAGHHASASSRIAAAEAFLDRAICSGSMLDPWNILGFGGHFPRFQAVEDAVTDPRVDTLLETMQEIFDAYALVIRECAATGDTTVGRQLEELFRQRADWWDRFATIEVSGVRRVSGSESLGSAQFVAAALAEWRKAGEQTGDVAFWRQRADRFSSTQSFGLVVSALREKNDYVSAMALMMQWLSDHEQCPLDEAGHSFHTLALDWMFGIVNLIRERRPMPAKDGQRVPEPEELLVKFFDFAEANAGPLWSVPTLDGEEARVNPENPFAAAYEGMTYEDSTDDENESSLAGESTAKEGPWSHAEELMRRLRFIGTLGRLWQLAAAAIRSDTSVLNSRLDGWIELLVGYKKDLIGFLSNIERQRLDEPGSAREAILEYERQSSLKEGLVVKASHILTEVSHALRALVAVRAKPAQAAAASLADWERPVIALESAWHRGPSENRADSPAAPGRSTLLSDVLEALHAAPLMYVPIDKGGSALRVALARYARDVVRRVATRLPSMGGFEGTYRLLDSVLSIEHEQSARADTMQISEFDLLFRGAYRALITRLVEHLAIWDETKADTERAMEIVGDIVSRFSQLWGRYIASVRLSELERRRTRTEWNDTLAFIERYGRDLFHQGFMTEGNLRGIVHQGSLAYLTDVLADDDADGWVIVEDLREGTLSLDRAADELDFIVRSTLEHYDAYRDYNTTTPQSDYGENLRYLLDLLRHKIEYERHRWALEPGFIAHNVLVRAGNFQAAELLRQAFLKETQMTAEAILERLSESEARCGFHLQTIRGRLAEGFVGPLRLDEILGLAERCLSAPQEDVGDAFLSLQGDIEDFRKRHLGSGVEVPEWLRLVEQLVDQQLEEREGRNSDFDDRLVRLAKPLWVSYDDFSCQMELWPDSES